MALKQSHAYLYLDFYVCRHALNITDGEFEVNPLLIPVKVIRTERERRML